MQQCRKKCRYGGGGLKVCVSWFNCAPNIMWSLGDTQIRGAGYLQHLLPLLSEYAGSPRTVLVNLLYGSFGDRMGACFIRNHDAWAVNAGE